MTALERGSQGERLMALALDYAFAGAQRYDNLIIPARDGLTQIDHVLLLPTGVFVVEVKKYRGDICGAVDSDQWTLSYRGHAFRFRNPLHQNARHISALKWQLGLKGELLKSVVAFVGGAALFRPIAPNVIATTAAGCPGVVDYIRGFKQELLSHEGLTRTGERLSELAAAGYTHEELLASIAERTSRQGRSKARRGLSPTVPHGAAAREGGGSVHIGDVLWKTVHYLRLLQGSARQSAALSSQS